MSELHRITDLQRRQIGDGPWKLYRWLLSRRGQLDGWIRFEVRYLSERFDTSEGNALRWLRRLREAGLISTRRRKYWQERRSGGRFVIGVEAWTVGNLCKTRKGDHVTIPDEAWSSLCEWALGRGTRGGARKGAGRPSGAKNKSKQLVPTKVDQIEVTDDAPQLDLSCARRKNIKLHKSPSSLNMTRNTDSSSKVEAIPIQTASSLLNKYKELFLPPTGGEKDSAANDRGEVFFSFSKSRRDMATPIFQFGKFIWDPLEDEKPWPRNRTVDELEEKSEATVTDAPDGQVSLADVFAEFQKPRTDPGYVPVGPPPTLPPLDEVPTKSDGAPLIEESWPERYRIEFLLSEYRAAHREVFGKDTFSYRKPGSLVRSKWAPRLAKAAAFMLEKDIAPRAWAIWSMEYSKSKKRKAQPIAILFALGTLQKRYGWFRRSGHGAAEQTMLISKQHAEQLYRRQEAQKLWRFGSHRRALMGDYADWYIDMRKDEIEKGYSDPLELWPVIRKGEVPDYTGY